MAAATDSRTLTCGSQLAAVSTTLPTAVNEMYVIRFSARDAAGNQAVPLRRYVMVTARCQPPEKWCPNVDACSTQGLCLRSIAAGTTNKPATSTSAASAYVPATDKTPPLLTLLGKGTAAVTATGAALMLDSVVWNSRWTDPGATAFDMVDGDLSASIQSYGVGAVDTSAPTAPSKNFSHVVEYFVEDKSHNAAPIARRLIKVNCPGNESYCADPNSSKPTCTVKGVCGAPVALVLAAKASTTSKAAAAAAASAGLSAPKLSLLVPGVAHISAGQGYDRCADDTPLSVTCERGVSATDTQDGNLDRQVLVCGNRWRPLYSSQRPVPITLACNVTDKYPGEYNLTFTVANSAGMTANVSRLLIVKAVCSSGERLCPDKVTCSTGGSCVSTAVNTIRAVEQEGTPTPPANTPPTISLITSATFGSIVRVRRGSSYEPCRPGVAPTADAPCEPGATATDPDGNVTAADGSTTAMSGPLDLTSQVVVCPPAECLSMSCSPVELRQHYFTTKGLQDCGIATAAAEDQQFQVDFWVWDRGMLNATVSRTVVIDKPCPDDITAYYCTDTNGKGFCSGSPCGQAEKLLPPAKPTPRIQLLPSAGTVYLEYGRPAPLYLGPCSSGTSNSSCGAVAWDEQAGTASVDLTPYITVTQACETTGDNQACTACNLEALSVSGSCLPGKYILTYSVTNDDGITVTAEHTLIVYRAGSISASFVACKDLTSQQSASSLAANLLHTSSQPYADLVAMLKANFGDVGAQLEASDVVVTKAQSVQVAASNYSVVVNATIYVYMPAGLHKKDVASAAQPVLDSGGRRHLLALQYETTGLDSAGILVAGAPASMVTASAAGRKAGRRLAVVDVDYNPVQRLLLTLDGHSIQGSKQHMQDAAYTAAGNQACNTKQGTVAGSMELHNASINRASIGDILLQMPQNRRRLLQSSSGGGSSYCWGSRWFWCCRWQAS
eukprot:GHRR01036794.1.p1 GENE.GHRR01036794.1~~GHRR01036794.1.p1  ORF type:complete len:1082 (+),score=385.26 GHRR01036794.1:389-3247(+)